MDKHQVIVVLLVVELVQIAAFWAYLRYRYKHSLRQMSRLTGQMATGQKPTTFYIDGPREVQQVSRHLETLGSRLEQYERAAREETSNLNLLLANMVEGVMVVDQKHVVRLFNDELLNLFQLKQSPLGRTVLESLREARVEMIVAESIQKGKPRQQEVTLEAGALGQPPRHFDISVVPIRTKKEDENGAPAVEVAGAVVVFHDITRMKQLEVLRQEFVSNVSHELRTPLAIFRGYLETLQDNPELPRDELQRIIETLQRHSDRLFALVEDLLTLSRFEAGRIKTEMSTIRMDAFFKQIVRDWTNRKNAAETELTLAIDESLPPVDADAIRLEQVVLNLLDNAVAYSNPPRKVELFGGVRDGMMEVRVTDNGIGIPPGDLPHIFERFYRVDKARSRSSGGTGLGLSIVKQILQLHGGSVRAESELGKGTSIILRLPLRQEK
ncbi:MAG TPA: ATP-binding protein [Candidatus Methylacidiphilales bacterium]|jgi:two-component system phosphate regulon sensor histidine kinase PhoR|nr:ATP-binding protein [Candidatus Methylacidiphilales bacterium]